MRTHNAAPSASSFLESLRDIGYSLETAVADILDNSITAKSTEIEIHLNVINKAAQIAIIDNGIGMTEEELLIAMRPGSKSPLDSRAKDDLGRFGLGLKTASFSQCRKLTVVTRKDEQLSAAQWDMDFIAKQEYDEWTLQIPEGIEIESIPFTDQIPETGTLILWERLDRLEDATLNTTLEDHLYENFDVVRKHLELIFHRFLDGEKPYRKVQILINDEVLKAFDPFHSKHNSTIIQPEEVIRVQNIPINIQPYVLPHHKKTTAADWVKYGGEAGYLKSQGFYVYRAGRLIIHGTWFRLAKQVELTKLSRVRVDMPNELDHLWKIDVKKSSAQPPLIVRERLKKIIDRICGASHRVYTQRGQKLVDPRVNAFWARRVDKGEISYEIDTEHPAIKGFYEVLDNDQVKKFNILLKVFGEYLPIDSLFGDIASHAENVVSGSCGKEDLKSLLEITCKLYKQQEPNISYETIIANLRKTEPFKSNYVMTTELLANEYKEVSV